MLFSHIWNVYLYQPLFNLLIWIYNNLTDRNLGWAVVIMTILLRIALLPFTLVNERNRVKNAELAEEIARLSKLYQSDPILRKEEIRKVLKQRRVQPWAKTIVLGIQALVLVLLYQVFLRGITGEKLLKFLYPSVGFPGVINTDFYGFDLGIPHNIFWAAIVGVWLLGEIYIDYRRRKSLGLKKSDLGFFVLFPFSVFLILWYLPMVKSLFIFTSLVFSLFIAQLGKIVFSSKTDKSV